MILSAGLVRQSGALQSTTSSSVTLEEHHDDEHAAGAERQQRQQPQPQQQPQQVSHKSPLNGRQFGDMINDIQIECNSNNIMVTLQTSQGFNGMIYPKGLSKNSSCMVEYHQLGPNITYYLPLKSCNTMSTDVEDGVEYFNTVMVQPHRRLVTNQGRGYHIRCRYQTKERVITNHEQQLSVNLTQSTPSVMGSVSMPTCTMRIHSAGDPNREVSAENVRIGDELQLSISLSEQDVYGMLVTNCLVRDGMDLGEQPLIDDLGCPVDEEIMPEFSYSHNLTRATVSFQAHKFPYTSSVYYQCNVRLCFREGGCGHVPPNCNRDGARYNQLELRPHFGSYKSAGEQEARASARVGAGGDGDGAGPHKQRSSSRTRRWVDGGELDGVASDELLRPVARHMSIEVSSGLHVDEDELEPSADSSAASAAALSAPADGEPLLAAASNEQPDEAEPATPAQRAERQRSEREFCMSLRKFAIIISLISLLLMTAIIIMIACLIQRRNRRKLESRLESTYDQHHSNRAYCRD